MKRQWAGFQVHAQIQLSALLFPVSVPRGSYNFHLHVGKIRLIIHPSAHSCES